MVIWCKLILLWDYRNGLFYWNKACFVSFNGFGASQDSAGKAFLGVLKWTERVLNCPFSIPKRLEIGVSAMLGRLRLFASGDRNVGIGPSIKRRTFMGCFIWNLPWKCNSLVIT